MNLQSAREVLEQSEESFSTGFKTLDEYAGGWHPGDLILIADDCKGWYASTFALQCAQALANAGKKPVGILSATASQRRLVRMLLGIHTGASEHDLPPNKYRGVVSLEVARRSLSLMPIFNGFAC